MIESGGLAGAPRSGFGEMENVAPAMWLPSSSTFSMAILAQVLIESGNCPVASFSCELSIAPPVRLRIDPCPKVRQVTGRPRAARLTEASAQAKAGTA